jgi:hypothetical protein
MQVVGHNLQHNGKTWTTMLTSLLSLGKLHARTTPCVDVMRAGCTPDFTLGVRTWSRRALHAFHNL